MSDSLHPAKAAAMLRTLGYLDTLQADGDAGRAVVAFRPGENHVNGDGVVQGGIITGWLDVAMTTAVFAVRGPGTRLASLEIKTAFMEPVLAGQAVRAEGWIVRLGRRIAFLEGRLLADDGQVLASASSTASVRAPEPGPGAAAGRPPAD